MAPVMHERRWCFHRLHISVAVQRRNVVRSSQAATSSVLCETFKWRT